MGCLVDNNEHLLVILPELVYSAESGCFFLWVFLWGFFFGGGGGGGGLAHHVDQNLVQHLMESRWNPRILSGIQESILNKEIAKS